VTAVAARASCAGAGIATRTAGTSSASRANAGISARASRATGTKETAVTARTSGTSGADAGISARAARATVTKEEAAVAARTSGADAGVSTGTTRAAGTKETAVAARASVAASTLVLQQPQKSTRLMERAALGTGPDLAVELAQSANFKEVARNFASAVEEIVESVGDVLLVDVVAVEERSR
jgi:hypothetical protein